MHREPLCEHGVCTPVYSVLSVHNVEGAAWGVCGVSCGGGDALLPPCAAVPACSCCALFRSRGSYMPARCDGSGRVAAVVVVHTTVQWLPHGRATRLPLRRGTAGAGPCLGYLRLAAPERAGVAAVCCGRSVLWFDGMVW